MSDPTPDLPLPSAICEEYQFPPGTFDEMCSEAGRLRPHWEYPMQALGALGPAGLQTRRCEADRLIRENGVTYNVYGDPRGAERGWELDLIPLLMQSEEWAPIERGLMQRAELLNLLLKDVYGPQTALRKGIVPPQIIFGHPGFLRACAGIGYRRDRFLPLYAADLARTPDGGMCVIGDRAQAPSGAGYALENRIVASRVLPSLFRDANVHRLAGFFRAMRSTLACLAPNDGDEARVVLLTPGPRNEAYFEHAYLANYLGYTLVQGEDLMVSNGSVWLRTLEDMQPVDVILRRVDDEYCDPLELREDSYLGVPGLVQATRMGRVSVVNPLGSGVLDNPALHACMPALAKHFLGEELRLPSIATWWCGESDAREHVLANLERLVIKPLSPGLGMRTRFGASLSQIERDELRQRILASPHRFVGQEPLALSTSPILAADGLQARHVVLRSFLAAGEESYVVMPGGLTRASASIDDPVVSNQRGGISKDTWVLASEPPRQESLLVQTRQVEPMVSTGGIPSRVADNLFWVGRYVERAETTARFLRVVLLQVIDQSSVSSVTESPCLHKLLRATTHLTTTYPGFMDTGSVADLANPEGELLCIIADPDRPSSLAQTLNALLQAARSVRDRLSADTWRVINDIDQELRALRAADEHELGETLDELDRLVSALVGLAGLFSENMVHGPGWVFLEIGRRMERASLNCRMLRSTLVPAAPPSEEAQLVDAVLGASDNIIAYRRRYRLGSAVQNALELVLCDETNPRAVAYQMVA